MSRSTLTRHWPILGLTLRTPRLTLQPMCEDDMAELLDLSLAGIHDPAVMPFAAPWTDAPAADLVANSLRYHWQIRAAARPDNWELPFVVRENGVVVGSQDLRATDFAVSRTVGTGSWLGLSHQGRGLGTEMRCAVLLFAFDQLNATHAESEAFDDNPRSLAVSRALGYRANGERVVQRRPGEAARERRLVVEPGSFVRPRWPLHVEAFEPTRSWFGI